MNQVKERVSALGESMSNLMEGEPREGKLTQTIEKRTAKIPSMLFLNLAIASIAGSAVLAFFRDRREDANFVGMWAPTFLLLGIYNKLVKIEGSDRLDHEKREAA
jgi:hypothetical protein